MLYTYICCICIYTYNYIQLLIVYNFMKLTFTRLLCITYFLASSLMNEMYLILKVNPFQHERLNSKNVLRILSIYRKTCPYRVTGKTSKLFFNEAARIWKLEIVLASFEIVEERRVAHRRHEETMERRSFS